MSKKPRTEDYADLRREREVREELNSAISALEKISNNDTKLEDITISSYCSFESKSNILP